MAKPIVPIQKFQMERSIATARENLEDWQIEMARQALRDADHKGAFKHFVAIKELERSGMSLAFAAAAVQMVQMEEKKKTSKKRR